MVLKPGFIQTEAGLIPEDWEVTKIASVANVKTGPFGSALHEKDYVQDGTPIITVEHLGELGVLHQNLPMVSNKDRRRLKAYSLEKGDIVFSRVGSVDRNSLIGIAEDGWLFSGRLLRIRVFGNKAYSPFLSYYFHSEPFKQRVRNVAVGQTMPSLNTRIISDIDIALPPLPEQRAIAAALSDVDALIASLNALIAKKRAIKQGAMQELLTGKRRLPGFNGEWRECELKDIGKFSKGKGIKKDEVIPDGYPCVRYGEIYTHYNDYIKDFISHIPFKVAKQSQRIYNGDLLFTGSGETAEEIGKCIAFLGFEEAYAGGDIVIFKPEGQDSRFLGYLMNHETIVAQKARMGQGDAVVHISSQKLSQIKLCLPSIKEQEAIVEVFLDMDAEITKIGQELQKTRLIKQGMMQELLTGRTRLV